MSIPREQTIIARFYATDETAQHAKQLMEIVFSAVCQTGPDGQKDGS